MLSAILYGMRISLGVGVSSGLIAACIGMWVGLMAGYIGGRFDTIIMRIVDLQLSFPSILVALMLLAVLGRGVDKIIIALVIVQWAYYTRTVRASALVERCREYMEAGRCLALSRLRIVFRHLLPNCMPPLIVVATVQVAHAISLEATLSFLGLGLPPTEPSLGLLMANGFDYIMSGRYWISTFPGIALLLAVGSINLVGDQLRDVLNPRLQQWTDGGAAAPGKNGRQLLVRNFGTDREIEPSGRELACSDDTYRSPGSGPQRSHNAHGHQPRWAVGVRDAHSQPAKSTGRNDLMVNPVDCRIDHDSDLRSVQPQTRKAQCRRRVEVLRKPQRSFPGGT